MKKREPVALAECQLAIVQVQALRVGPREIVGRRDLERRRD